MTERSSPTRPASSPDADTTRSTLSGSESFAKRHVGFKPGFFRPTSYGTKVSSLGIGTYLGESTDADDEAYERSVVHAIASGINLIDTAINYRSQRSERCHRGGPAVSLRRGHRQQTRAHDLLEGRLHPVGAHTAGDA